MYIHVLAYQHIHAQTLMIMLCAYEMIMSLALFFIQLLSEIPPTEQCKCSGQMQEMLITNSHFFFLLHSTAIFSTGTRLNVCMYGYIV